ncbi:MAG: SseB family protein, partial [Polyangiales bacterium]
WEPRAEGFRTLINGNGEEALAVFTSESALSEAARRFGWLEADGQIATHESLGSDILRHAWTREYAFLVVDIAENHSLEFDREELRVALRELDRTGPFRTSRPPAPNKKAPAASSSFPPPVEKISTMYSMAPSQAEQLDRLSDLPTKPHELPSRTEPPTQRHPRVKAEEVNPATGTRPSSRPAAKPDSNPPPKIEEVVPESAKINVGGTYGAASIVPPNPRRALTPARDAERAAESTHPVSEASPSLQSDLPTSPAVRASDLAPGGKLALPPAPEIGMTAATPANPSEQPAAEEDEPVNRPSRLAAPSIGDSIELARLRSAPADTLLGALSAVLRQYPEIEWASYCEVARPAGAPSPAVGLRVMDTYRDNVTVIIKELCEAGRTQDVELDVLLVDGHDLLRKAREAGFVFFPWKPKPFGG